MRKARTNDEEKHSTETLVMNWLRLGSFAICASGSCDKKGASGNIASAVKHRRLDPLLDGLALVDPEISMRRCSICRRSWWQNGPTTGQRQHGPKSSLTNSKSSSGGFASPTLTTLTSKIVNIICSMDLTKRKHHDHVFEICMKRAKLTHVHKMYAAKSNK